MPWQLSGVCITSLYQAVPRSGGNALDFANGDHFLRTGVSFMRSYRLEADLLLAKFGLVRFNHELCVCYTTSPGHTGPDWRIPCLTNLLWASVVTNGSNFLLIHKTNRHRGIPISLIGSYTLRYFGNLVKIKYSRLIYMSSIFSRMAM